jgi:hypothetical protein
MIPGLMRGDNRTVVTGNTICALDGQVPAFIADNLDVGTTGFSVLIDPDGKGWTFSYGPAYVQATFADNATQLDASVYGFGSRSLVGPAVNVSASSAARRLLSSSWAAEAELRRELRHLAAVDNNAYGNCLIRVEQACDGVTERMYHACLAAIIPTVACFLGCPFLGPAAVQCAVVCLAIKMAQETFCFIQKTNCACLASMVCCNDGLSGTCGGGANLNVGLCCWDKTSDQMCHCDFKQRCRLFNL